MQWAIGRCAALMLATWPACPALAGPRATTDSGIVAGTGEGPVDVFRGIPYAAPPVGPDRWRSPRPVSRWTGARDATRFGHSCWQAVSPAGFGPWSHEYVVSGDISEDCLFLNVWTPARRVAARAVLVWIHGGGFNSGSGAIPIYDGRALAARGIVVVTINYRVGVFGFLSHPELTAEAGTGVAGNFGLQDMVAALRWVRANIAAFGGDPARVTIAGQSAGSMAVHDLVASPLAAGLFAQAIGESGLPRPPVTPADAERQGVAFAREKHAASLAALRSMPAEVLQSGRGANAVRFVPVADGALLPAEPWHPLDTIAMLVGFNADEGSALGQNYGSADPARLQGLLADSFGSWSSRFAPFYPAVTAEERIAADKQVRRDRAAAALLAWREARAAGDRAPVFAYQFTHVTPGPGAGCWGAFHSSEIPYVFDTLSAAPERHWTAGDRQLATQISGYWLNFIQTGNPNGAGLPHWPAMRADAPRWLLIGDRTRASDLLPQPELDLVRSWQTHEEDWR